MNISIEQMEKEVKEYMSKTNSFYNTNDFKLEVKVVNSSNNEFPSYEYDAASGFDLRANLGESEFIILGQNDFKVIPTGLFVEIPNNTELQIRPRSGLAAKNGITVLNSPGTVDADYRGEIKVILCNISSMPFTVKNGMKIAQAVLAPVYTGNFVNLIKVDDISELSSTNRGEKGFGSTGL
jgi:dUTP pyrophosphatase